MLGPVRCPHRWTGSRLLPYPRTPTAAGYDEESDVKLQVGVCKRCGCARIRLYVSENRCSGWSHVDSWAELLLGRELDEHECRQVKQKMVLN